MTTMFEPFFGIPQAIVQLGKVKSLSGVALKLYVVLLHQSERYRTRMLRCTTAELEEFTGCSRNALITARADLARAGLVQSEPHRGQGFVFHLCDPNTGKPWPGDPKQRIMYVKKGEPSSALSSAGEAVLEALADIDVEVTTLREAIKEGNGITPKRLEQLHSEAFRLKSRFLSDHGERIGPL